MRYVTMWFFLFLALMMPGVSFAQNCTGFNWTLRSDKGPVQDNVFRVVEMNTFTSTNLPWLRLQFQDIGINLLDREPKIGNLITPFGQPSDAFHLVVTGGSLNVFTGATALVLPYIIDLPPCPASQIQAEVSYISPTGSWRTFYVGPLEQVTIDVSFDVTDFEGIVVDDRSPSGGRSLKGVRLVSITQPRFATRIFITVAFKPQS